MNWSPRFAFASLAMVLAFGLAHAQTNAPSCQPTRVACPAPSNGGPGVAVEVRVVRIGDALFAELMKSNRLDSKSLVTVDDKMAKVIIGRILADAESECVAAPRIMAMSGQEAKLVIGSEMPFVTDLKLVRVADQAVIIPQSQTLTNGCSITVVPTITPDQGHVMMRFQAEQSEMPCADVPLFPVTTFITPVFEGGAQGQPIPFTQFIQQPTQFKRTVTNAFGIADGQTGLIYGGHTARTDKQIERVPFFADLPIVGGLFETECDKPVSNHLVYMVTPQIVVAPPMPVPCQAACCPMQPVPSLMPTRASMAVVQAANRTVAVPPPMPVCIGQQQSQSAVCPATVQPPCKLAEIVQTDASTRMVSIRCTIIRIDEAFFDRADAEAWSDLSPRQASQPGKIIDADTANRFCRSIKAQKGGEVLAQPIMTTTEGHSIRFQHCGEPICIQNVAFMERNGVTVPDFTSQTAACGIGCVFDPKLSADGKVCHLNMTIDETKVAGKRPASCEVTVRIPATEDTEEIVRTETVQAVSSLSSRNFSTGCAIPCGRCLMVYFSKEETDNGIQHFALLVEPSASECVRDTATTVRPMSAPARGFVFRPCDSKDNCVYPYPVAALEERMALYHKACAEERWSDARRLAAACLELDPKCFLPK